jgi:hypothetical protein
MTNRTDNRRHTPATPEAIEIQKMLDAYQESLDAARSRHNALSQWGAGFIKVQPGDIVEAGKRFNSSGCSVRAFNVTGTFKGWSGSTMRMLVETVDAVLDPSLPPQPNIQILIKGVPINDAGLPFEGAACHATVELVRQAIDSDFNSGAGYDGYLNDAMARFVDNAHSPTARTGKVR